MSQQRRNGFVHRQQLLGPGCLRCGGDSEVTIQDSGRRGPRHDGPRYVALGARSPMARLVPAGLAILLLVWSCAWPTRARESATSGDLTVTVMDVKCGASVSDGRGRVLPKGQFCRLSMTVRNDGSGVVTVVAAQTTVKDSNGKVHRASAATMGADGSIFLKQIHPGKKVTGVAYYDVPAGTKPVTVEFRGSALSSPAEVSLP